jgi:hypothetical protein
MGEQIRLTRHDLAEICMGFQMAAESVLAPMAQIAKDKGLLVDPTPEPRQ